MSFLVTLVAIVATTGGVFNGGLWAGAAITGAILGIICVWIVDRQCPRPRKVFIILWFCAIILVGASMLWSVHPHATWLYTTRVVGFMTPLLFWSSPALLSRCNSKQFFAILPWLAIAASLALTLEIDSGGVLLKLIYPPQAQLTEYDRGFSYLVLFSFPLFACLWLERRKILAAALLIALLICTCTTPSRATQAGLAASILVAIAAYFLPRATRFLLAALVFCITPWAFAARFVFLNHRSWLSHLPESWRDRVEIWDYLSYRIAERPWLGWGMGTIPKLDFMHPHGKLYLVRIEPATHGHNFLTQLWVEAGLPGIALGWAVALIALLQINRLPRKIAPFATGAWTMAMSLSCVSYNFWTDSLFSAFVLTSVGFVLLDARLSKQNFAK